MTCTRFELTAIIQLRSVVNLRLTGWQSCMVYWSFCR